MGTSSYTVVGMTCDHCVKSVREEVGQLRGVTAVDVDLAGGKLDITAAAPVADDTVRMAVQEAGYELAGR